MTIDRHPSHWTGAWHVIVIHRAFTARTDDILIYL
jgi:hypothetical protein